MKRILLALGWVLALLSIVGADPQPSTLPTGASEPPVDVPGESSPVAIESEGYKAEISWYPAGPKPGDLVRFRFKVSAPGGDVSALVCRVSLTRTGPGGTAALVENMVVPPETTPGDGRYVITQVFYKDGVYRMDFGVDDLGQGKKVVLKHEMTIGSPKSSGLSYGIGIGGAVLIVIVLAFGLRKPAA